MKITLRVGISIVLLFLSLCSFAQEYDTPEVLDRLAVGQDYERGRGVPVDIATAQSIYQQEADNGSRLGKVLLAQLYLLTPDPNWKNVDLAHQLLDDLVNEYVVQAIYLKGYAHMFGTGVPIDYDKAEELLVKSVNAQHKSSLYTLGYMYYGDFAGKQDYVKAFKLFEFGTFQDHANCHFMLGLCYENGQGIDQDIAKAEYHYTKALEGGNMLAEDALSSLQQNHGARKAMAHASLSELNVSLGSDSEKLLVEFYLKESDHVKIELFDFFGRLIYTLKDEMLASGQQRFKFQTNIGSGIYIVRLSSTQTTRSTKIVK
ncbi:MAG: T9SS type A sorting domain-containing protein [Bacteroidota bacterium]